VNFVGHIVVAALTGAPTTPTPDAVLLGAAVPDFAAWRRFRMIGAQASGTHIGDGITLHHRTDSIFHAHPSFTDSQRRIRDQLVASNVPRGAARACAHVGIEMMIDGALLRSPDTQRATQRTLGAIGARPDGLALLTREPAEQWLAHLDSVAAYGIPSGYLSPPMLAERLFRILRGRRRLVLPAEHVETVATVLGAHRNEIVDFADALAHDVADTLTLG